MTKYIKINDCAGCVNELMLEAKSSYKKKKICCDDITIIVIFFDSKV